jgi:hypothetical protein
MGPASDLTKIETVGEDLQDKVLKRQRDNNMSLAQPREISEYPHDNPKSPKKAGRIAVVSYYL